jgi:hypothetical protein
LRRSLLALAMAMLALAALYLATRPSAEESPLPDDPLALARRVRSHPADWRAAGALSEHALDARVPQRVALWHAANDIAMRLAPIRQAPRMQLARAAFFHWTQLNDADRRAALETIAPLLRDEETFSRMAKPLFDLTGDLTLLRRWNPGTARSLELLRNLAATNGRFDDYRALRAEVVQQRTHEFDAGLPHLPPADLVGALPPPPYSTDDEPLLRAALAEFHRRPLTEDPHYAASLDALVDYALRHRLGPLDGIDSVVHMPQAVSPGTRRRLAEATGVHDAELDVRGGPPPEPRGVWRGVGENGRFSGVAATDRELSGPSSIVVEPVKSDEVPPYVEVYVDDSRVAEGEVAAPRTFALPAAAGVHRIAVAVVNPLTRNAEQRVVRIVNAAP